MTKMINEKVYIWGAGKYGKLALDYCNRTFDVVGFIDKRAGDGFREYCLLPVISHSEFFSTTENVIVIIAIQYPAEVSNLLIGLENVKVYIFDGRNTNNYLLYKVENNEICCPEYMDKEYIEWQPYSEHYSKQSPFIINIFNTALKSILQNTDDVRIIEIGCGSGLFANMLFDNGYINYLGIDFSPQAIKLAKKANPEYEDKFACIDAFEFLKSYSETDNTVFVLFEVLEHINRDIDILKLIPDHSTVIFSVPNFKSFNHVRTFNNLNDITARYTMLKINKYCNLPSQTSGKYYHLCEAVKTGG